MPITFDRTFLRRAISAISLIALLTINILSSWQKTSSTNQHDSSFTLAEQILISQSKVYIAINKFLNDHPQILATFHSNYDSLTTKTQGGLQQTLALTPTINYHGILSKLIVANYFKLTEAKKTIISQIDTKQLSALESSVFNLINENLSSNPEQELEIIDSWGFLGELLIVNTAQNPEGKNFYQEKTTASAIAYLNKLSGGILGILILAISSLFALSYFSSRLIKKQMGSRFSLASINSLYLIECFVLYLALMLIIPHIISNIFAITSITGFLRVNCYAILSSILILFWLKLNGHTASQIFSGLGLSINSTRYLIREAICGFVGYLGFLPILILVLLAYSLALQYFGIDISQGTHPIIPIFAGTSSQESVWWIVILAVIVAPFVEEIMFRGIFYSWLRSYFGFGASVIISSLTFATLHPQGVVGIVPLTAIGILLASLREWRGSLFASMVAHACFNAGTIIILSLFFR